MAVIRRTLGTLMLAYSALYSAHFVFDALYDAGPVWTVFNVISATGIVVALAACARDVRSMAPAPALCGSLAPGICPDTAVREFTRANVLRPSR